ncbi:MAG: hypothetical protein V3W34_03255, partial [Phycisphaerae bacterium]
IDRGGEWLEGQFCKDDPCPPGACCLPDESCEVLRKQECTDRQGQWYEGKACNEIECPLCNGREAIKRPKCKTWRGKVKKVTVKVIRGTPGEEYTATLDTGQIMKKSASQRGKVKFKFTRDDAPECGSNGVTVCDKHRDFDCDC